jgi:trimeric autotransporter adhesin
LSYARWIFWLPGSGEGRAEEHPEKSASHLPRIATIDPGVSFVAAEVIALLTTEHEAMSRALDCGGAQMPSHSKGGSCALINVGIGSAMCLSAATKIIPRGSAVKSVRLGFIATLALVGTAYAQVPATNDKSDERGNTGMGTGALGKPAASNPGFYNTASGYQALYSNTSEYGDYNTASGSQALYYNTSGSFNTAAGMQSLYFNTDGSYNTASGMQALYNNTDGSYNTASGYYALLMNTTGGVNTASGASALYSNTSGSGNSAFGFEANYFNTTGSGNSAFGYEALLGAFTPGTGSYNTAMGGGALSSDSTGSYNVATGYYALFYNTTGSYNVASGYYALFYNQTGQYNTASGYQALLNNNGVSNTASGYQAMYSNNGGANNTATGVHALANNVSGSGNVAEGWHAGINLTTGSNNIDIGSPGSGGDTNTIRVGVQGTQAATFVAGIYGHSLTGSEVVVTPSGELGVLSSSERFKTAIAPMGSDTAKLGQLRPVTFKLKADATGTRQYGLIAEEVAKVYPELVIRNEAGRIDGVRYDELAPMLLNEVQKQERTIAAQAAEIRALQVQAHAVAGMQKQLAEMHAALVKVQAGDKLVAQR